MKNISNHIISSILGITLVGLVGGGIRNPSLFEQQGYSGTITFIAGGLIGVLSPKNNGGNDEIL